MDIERDLFQERHIGPSPEDQASMLTTLGYDSLDKFLQAWSDAERKAAQERGEISGPP